MRRVFIIGSNGRLGSALSYYNIFDEMNYSIIKISNKIYDASCLYGYGADNSDIVVNCAAFTDVKGSENKRNQCYKTNVELPYALGEAQKDLGFKLVLFSTDYVLRKEWNDNWYTKTKKEMEDFCFQRALIIRVSNLIGQTDKKGTNIISKLLSAKSLSIGDVYIYPTLLDEINICRLCSIILTKNYKTINLFGPEIWLPHFAEQLFKRTKQKTPHIWYNTETKSKKISTNERIFKLPFSWKTIERWGML